MNTFLKSDIGRGITGAILSIGITLAVLFPIVIMELFSKLINL